MIIRGDRLAESERVNGLSLMHAGLWALLLSNPKLVDDFGCLRWSAAQLVATLFPRRQPTPARAVLSFMRAAEKANLVEVYSVDGQDFAAVRNWCGVEPARRQYHRAPLPPSSTHVCGAHRCARSGAHVSSLWRQPFVDGNPRKDEREDLRAYTRLSVPSVPSVPSEPLGSTDNGRIEWKVGEGRSRETANPRTCEAEECARPATGASGGRYVCDAHAAAPKVSCNPAAPAPPGRTREIGGDPARSAVLEAFQKAGFDAQ